MSLIQMKKEMENRLKELKEEYQKGQEQLVALEQDLGNVRDTMLRLSGAIQVLQELLGNKILENSISENNSLDLVDDSERRS